MAWNLANESLLAGSTRLSILTLRASLGRAGGAAAAAVGSAAGWETTTTLNAGLDFGFWHQRVTGSVDWYRLQYHAPERWPSAEPGPRNHAHHR